MLGCLFRSAHSCGWSFKAQFLFGFVTSSVFLIIFVVGNNHMQRFFACKSDDDELVSRGMRGE